MNQSNHSQADLSLRDAQQQVDQWIKTIGVRYFNELTNLGVLMEEVGELSRIMVRQYGEQSFKETDKTHTLSDELADVLFVLICIANQTGINLTEAFEKNLAKKTQRDRDRHQTNEKLTK
jgi:NTP pyrophosphatase (non-canonical NTP hydrolase)